MTINEDIKKLDSKLSKILADSEMGLITKQQKINKLKFKLNKIRGY